jgi:hypothetical protein
LAETLGPRDLEKITTFAEFVKAKRIARNYPQRAESAAVVEEPVSAPAHDGDEEPTPSSRRRTAAW